MQDEGHALWWPYLYYFKAYSPLLPILLTWQSTHLFPIGLTLLFNPPGLAYGLALARALSSLFSPMTREAPGRDGSAVATFDVFCR